MPRFTLLDSRQPLIAAGLVAALGTLAALPAARAERAGAPARAGMGALPGDGEDQRGDLLARTLRLTLPAWPPAVLGWGWAPGRVASPLRLWLSRPWPLPLAARQSPAALVALWLTSGVHRLLDRLALPEPRPEVLLRHVLAGLTIAPVSGEESSGYGYRRDPFSRRRKLHKGVDYRARRGTPVYAAGPGIVRVARRRGGYGRVVMIAHGQGVETRYAHLRRIAVEPGQRVAAGALIGRVGATGRATGPHLHFELRIDDEPRDPRRVLGPLLPRELLAAAP